MLKAVIAVSGVLLLFGGVGYSEMPGGNFWVGIGEAAIGAAMLWWQILSAQ